MLYYIIDVRGRKVRSNKGTLRGPRTGKTRSGKRFRTIPILKKTRKVRSNKGKKRTPYGQEQVKLFRVKDLNYKHYI